jgi:DNA-binding response OmpR family regulator
VTAARKGSILWVDDEIDLLKSQIMFLEDRGYDVTPVSNGEDAVGLVKGNGFDLVLLDQMMPGMDGLSTLVRIKDIAPSLPVVMITKMEEEDLIDEALRKRIDDFLLKPVNPVQILSAARRILETRQIREAELSHEFVEDFNEIETLKSRAQGWRDWLNIHIKLSEWDIRLDQYPDSGLMQSHLDQRRQCNVEYSMYMEKVYKDWVWDGDRPYLSVDVMASFVAPQLSAGRKVYFIILDCLRLDQYMAIEPMLEPYFGIRRDYYFSILPSATPYSRNAIFAGLFPSEIAEKYPEYWDEAGSEEMGKNRFEKQLLDRQLKKMGLKLSPSAKYIKVYDADEAIGARRQVPTLQNVPLVAMVFNFVDIVAHSRSESVVLQEILPDESAYRSFTRSWFMHSPLYDILKMVAAQDATVVLTTDHGSILGKRSAVALGDRETSTNVRYKFGTNLNCDERQAVRVKDPLDYKLPPGGINKNYIIAKEDYYFVYPTNFHEYERHYRDSFQHGGISMEEMILPCVTLTPKR